jgi:hypothetical protein
MTTEPNQKIDPGFVVRARLRRTAKYVASGRCRNPNALTQTRHIAKIQRKHAVEELIEWAKLCEELGVKD